MALVESGVERKTFWQAVRNCSGTPADRTNQYRFLAWTAVWAVCFVAATWALQEERIESGMLTWLVAIAPLGPGIIAFGAYLRFVRMADELLRKIQFESLAFGFGCGVIAGLGYPLLERAGAPPFPELMLLVMMFGWAGRQLWAMYQYR